MKYEKNYSSEIRKLIDNIVLDDLQKEKLKECMCQLPSSDRSNLSEVFEDMYKLYVNDMSTSDIGKIYDRDMRTIQLIFRKLGMSRDRFKAQSIAVKKRDYVQIRESNKKTMIKRMLDNNVYGTKIEQFIRADLALKLNIEIKKMGGEAIVGVNTITPVGELDIPIIVLINNKYYKYGIEIDGKGYHANGTWGKRENKEKPNKLKNIGYKLFRINTKAYCNGEKTKEIVYLNGIQKELLKIIAEIKKDIEVS